MTTIALAGNPNAGKSTLFNALTGSDQHVGNWPGKTVEKKAGFLRLPQEQVTIVDLPGTYSLNASSVEEVIARDFIIDDHPDIVLLVIDAANVERNLYLVLQVLEMGIPMMLALNMADVAERRNIHIDDKKLSEKLGNIPIIRTVGYRQQGLDEIRAIIAQRDQSLAPTVFQLRLPAEIETEIAVLATDIQGIANLSQQYLPRWLAIKLLEGDKNICDRLAPYPTLLSAAAEGAKRIEAALDSDPDLVVAEARYDLIGQWTREIIHNPATNALTPTDRIDKILTNRLLGLPIFFGLMWLVFQITANISAPYLDWIDGVMAGPITHWMTALLQQLQLDTTWFGALMIDGVIVGVGSVLVFVPVLMSLYFSIAILEDSGYMSRAAFVMDRAMFAFGLQGKSFLPLLVGFGCTVPAIYATRTLENETDRKITGFLTTFMSCGARLPVYVLFGAVFFSGSGTFVFGMYLIGIGVAVLTSFLFTRIVFRNKPITPFVMELPPYRTPNLRVIWRTTKNRTVSFLKHAGTLIFLASIGIWLLLAIPTTDDESFNDVAPEYSLYGTVSKGIAPVFAPAGFGEWQASGSLVTGFLAKEVVISSLSQVYGNTGTDDEEEALPSFTEDTSFIFTSFGEATITTAQEVLNILPRTVNIVPGVDMPEFQFLNATEEEEDQPSLESALRDAFTPLSALAFNIFILLYVPCMAAVGAMRHEFGWRWMLLQVGYTSFVAWLTAVLVYQVGLALGA